MDRNALLALFLTLLVWIAWIYFYGSKYEQHPKVMPKQEIEKKKKEEKKIIKKATTNIQDFSWIEKEGNINDNIPFKKGRFNIVFTERGGGIRDLVYTYKNTRTIDVHLVKKGTLWGFRIYKNPALMKKDFYRKWSLLEKDENGVAFSIRAKKGDNEIEIVKRYEFPLKLLKKDVFKLKIRVKNLSDSPVSFDGFFIEVGDGIGPGAITKVDEHNPLNKEDVFYIDKEDDDEEITHTVGVETTKLPVKVIGVMSRFFLLGMYDNNRILGKALYIATDNDKKIAIPINLGEIAPSKYKEISFDVYSGLKQEDRLEAANPLLSEIVKGFMHSIISPIERLVEWFLIFSYKYIYSNYGVGIILITIIFKLILSPLSVKSMKSMKKMKELAPKIQELRERYKDDPQELNKRIMELYRKHKVNPFGGCLPLLLQIPIFFGLYRVLANSIVLWQEGFLWIKDLSAPDTIFFLKLTSSYEFPVNLLPIVMTVTSVIQQKLSGAFSDPNQKKMAIFMTLFFVFIFWNLPAGLVLYWTVYNILSAFEQLFINKQKK